MPGVRDVRTLGWPLMVVVGVQDVGKDAGGPADRRTGGPADRRTGGPAWRVAAVDGGGRCFGRKSGPAHPSLVPMRRERGGKHPAPSPRDLDSLR